MRRGVLNGHTEQDASVSAPKSRAIAWVFFGIALPAQAIPPKTDSFSDAGTDFWASCDGFDIIVNFHFTARVTEFYNADGDLVRVRGYFFGTGELVKTETGKTNTGSGPQVFFDNFRTETTTFVALQFHNTVPQRRRRRDRRREIRDRLGH